jgi:hypothetical protein
VGSALLRWLEVLRSTAGTLVMVPSGTAHTFANHGPGNLRVLVVMTLR